MGFRDLAAMKRALAGRSVTAAERAVLLDMATALQGSLRYSWGHDRLAEAIGKTPGTAAAKQALSGRIIPSLIAKGLIVKVADAHRTRRAVYDLAVLHAEPVDNAEMGNGSEAGMGIGFGPERVTVSGGMGNAQTVTPAKDQRQGERRASAPALRCPKHPDGNSSTPCRGCAEAREARAAQPTVSAMNTVQPGPKGWCQPGEHRRLSDGSCLHCDHRLHADDPADTAAEATHSPWPAREDVTTDADR